MNVQMNVRIDEKLKAAGDEVFSSIGLTPSQVVRQVWEFAASHREAPEIVAGALQENDIPRTSEKERRVGRIRGASSVCAQLRERFGLKPPDKLEELDYHTLREQAVYERMEKRGLA